MTKVLRQTRRLAFVALCSQFALATPVFSSVDASVSKPAEALYLELRSVGLDPERVYHVRDASLERSGIHITLEDGTIAFTQDVMGRITGAFFEGDGEVLLSPPNEVERRSMSLFTGMAILEERFETAYFRFNDDTFDQLKPDLRANSEGHDFFQHWNETAKNLAQVDAMRLLLSFGRLLPAEDGSSDNAASGFDPGDRMLHARLQGTELGIFDVLYDSTVPEQVEVGQARISQSGQPFYDVWCSFAPVTVSPSASKFESVSQSENAQPREEPITIRDYVISAEIMPPKEIRAEARLEVQLRTAARRVLFFELSRFLQVENVEMDGRAIEFIHNPAIEGTQLARRGNDLIAVILPRPSRGREEIQLRFVYAGEVLADAGNGLLYVGARGTWYPNRGLAMANFDLTFQYPEGWTLVATGKPASVSEPARNGEKQSRWVSERPIPVAGFDLGKYRMASVQAGNVTVETYATRGVERDFPTASVQVIQPPPAESPSPQAPVKIVTAGNPSPTHMQVAVAESAAQAIRFFAERFGPFPYTRLAFTQMPGRESQGWPSLVFLSSYAFLTDAEREQLHFEGARKVLQRQIPAHETAHQWWGDLISWSNYRDQWWSEGLANYSSLMILQEKDPASFRKVMELYRDDLMKKHEDGMSPIEAGPVTLGSRLLSSRFPEGYEAISYGRGTWLFHMLRTMLNDASAMDAKNERSNEEPFVRALRKLRERYEGKSITTRELFEVFAEELPPALRYEGKQSLDWFLVGWVNGTALPHLELHNVKLVPHSGSIMVSGTIVQTDAPNDLVTSVPVYAVLASKQQVLLGRVFADGEESAFHVLAPPRTRKIVLDPHQTILTRP